MKVSFDLSTLDGTVEAAKVAAIRYRALTGKPLGITAEVGEFLVSRLLGLELSGARQPGSSSRKRDTSPVVRSALVDSPPQSASLRQLKRHLKAPKIICPEKVLWHES